MRSKKHINEPCYGQSAIVLTMLKKIFAILCFFSFSTEILSEEYLCSFIVGDGTETKSYERVGDYFLYPTQGWAFEILHENETHIMLGNINYWTYDDPSTTLFLTIINKKTLNFSERFIKSEISGDSFFSGTCSIKRY